MMRWQLWLGGLTFFRTHCNRWLVSFDPVKQVMVRMLRTQNMYVLIVSINFNYRLGLLVKKVVILGG